VVTLFYLIKYSALRPSFLVEIVKTSTVKIKLK
jgi:hypothetical protein